MHDRNDYPDPQEFRPERFLTADGTRLDPSVRDPSAAFGFGRRYVFDIYPYGFFPLSCFYSWVLVCLAGGSTESRDSEMVTDLIRCRVCPGKHMAYSMLYIAIASILSAFEIKKVVGEDGKEVEPKKEFVSSMVS